MRLTFESVLQTQPQVLVPSSQPEWKKMGKNDASVSFSACSGKDATPGHQSRFLALHTLGVEKKGNRVILGAELRFSSGTLQFWG